MSAEQTKETARKQGATTFGGAWLHRALILMLRYMGLKTVYAVMHVFAIPPALIFSSGARIAYSYYRHRRGYGRWKSLRATYANHCIFGKTVVDKFAVYAGYHFDVNMHDDEGYEKILRQDKPIIQFNAHIGSSEMLGYMRYMTKACSVLVDGGEKPELMAMRAATFGKHNVKMISVGNNEQNSEDIIKALDNNEMVSVFADRFFNAGKVVTSTIHGHRVRLARGPFALAVTRGIDVVMVCIMKEKDGSYSGYYEELRYDKSLSSKEQRQQLADAYTAAIEHIMELYPEQWFNYFNLWLDE